MCGRGFSVVGLPREWFRAWRQRDLLNLRLGEIQDTTDGLRQLVEEGRISRNDLIGNRAHRHHHVAGANQRDPDHRHLDANAPRVADKRFEAPGVGLDLDNQGGNVAILIDPAFRLTQASGPRDSHVRSDGTKGEASKLRRLAFVGDVEKLHAKRPQ